MKPEKKERLKEDAVIELVSVLREGGFKPKEIESYLRSGELRNLLNEWAEEISDEISQREKVGDEAYEKVQKWYQETIKSLLKDGYKEEVILKFFQSQEFDEWVDKVRHSNKVIKFRPRPSNTT